MIKHILYVQPIFAPDQRRCDRNTNSIKSMGDYIKINGTDGIQVTVVFGGWAKTPELWDKIKSEILHAFGPSINAIVFDKNYGKAMVVNKLVEMAKQQNVGYHAILTADSDILFPLENHHMFGRLAYAAIQLENIKKKPFGMMALNQSGECCHWKCCYENSTEYSVTTGNQTIVEKIVWPTNPSGIAGGCLFISRKVWEVLRGYQCSGLYAGDDAFLLLYTFQAGFSHQMIDTITIVHPPENDAEWSAFKVKVCQRDSLTGPKSNIDHLIKEMDEFWDNHDKT
jgi:hypothetical protein